MKETNLMKIILFFTVFAIIILGEELRGQDENFSNKLEIINAFRKQVEGERYGELLNNYKIMEGDKNKKIEKKRVLFSKMYFDLPYNLVFRDVKSIIPDNSNKYYIEPNSSLIGNDASIYSNNLQSRIGTISVAYTDSQYLARRVLAANIFIDTNRLLAADEFFRPTNIGNDICLKRTDNERLYFIRDYTVIKIVINDPKNINIEEIARYIDQKFVELNKELNKPEKKP